MTAELALYSPGVLADKVEYCRLLADSGLLPDAYRRQPANVLYAVEYGEVLGVPAMAAITGIHIIKGKPSASAGLVGALVRKAGHKLRVKGNDTSARAVVVRADDPEFEFVSEWTLERAVTAKLCTLRDGKPYARDKNGEPTSWEKYPAAMLKHRAVTEVARDACEEVLFGLHYSPEELGAEVNEDGEPIAITVEQGRAYTPQDAAEAVARKEQADRQMVDIAPRGQRNPFDPDFDLPPMPGTASAMPASDAQLTKLAILVGEKRGVSGNSTQARAARLEILGKMVRRPITTGRDLTLREASELIESLTLEPPFIADAEVVEDTPARPSESEQDAAAHAEAAKLAATDPESDPERIEADLRDSLETAATVEEIGVVWSRVQSAESARGIDAAAVARLSAAATRREDVLKADSGWSHRTSVGRAMNEVAA